MANAAAVTISATLLPDNIAKTIAGTMTVTPADTSEKWYYKFTECTTGDTNLIAGSFLDYTAVDDDSAPIAIDAADQVKFLFIKNTSAADGVVLSLEGGTPAFNLADGIFIGPEQSWFGRLPNVTVDNLHASAADLADAGDASVDLIVAAIIHDVSV